MNSAIRNRITGMTKSARDSQRGQSTSRALALAAAAVFAGSAGIAYGDAIAFNPSTPTAMYIQSALGGVTAAVNGLTSQTGLGWAIGSATNFSTQTTGGESLGGSVAVFPLTTATPSGSNGTNLTFDLYQNYGNQRLGGFEIEVTTYSGTPSVVYTGGATHGYYLNGTFSPVTIDSVTSATNKTLLTIDPNPTTAATYGDYVIAQNNGTEGGSGTDDTYQITAFSTMTGITGVELIAFYTLPSNGTGSATAGTGDGVGLDTGNFVLTQITGTATAVAAPEPTALGLASISTLMLLRRRRRSAIANGADNGLTRTT